MQQELESKEKEAEKEAESISKTMDEELKKIEEITDKNFESAVDMIIAEFHKRGRE